MPESEHPLPIQPEPAPDATLRLKTGVPAEPGGTIQIPKITLDELREPPIKLPPPILNEPTLKSPRFRLRRRGGWLIPALLGGLTLVGGVAYLVFLRAMATTPATVAPPASAEAVPPGAQAYLEQAKAGDAHAMRMLGVMYYYGLNVPKDREKGLYWYREAAAKGSEAARAELSKLELSGK
jgi:hypothetical protein